MCRSFISVVAVGVMTSSASLIVAKPRTVCSGLAMIFDMSMSTALLIAPPEPEKTTAVSFDAMRIDVRRSSNGATLYHV